MNHVLVVDDKDENLYYLQTLLENSGYAVDTARHGAEALTKARMRPPRFVVSDLLMPVMDGYTLLRHWKCDARLRAVPFIVYTATYTNIEDERLALSLGADAFILKPCEPDVILARIDEVLSKGGAASAAPTSTPAAESEQLKLYSETLIRKLEEKTLQLEESNRALREDVQKRERVEVALRESQALLRIAGSAARLGGFSMSVPEAVFVWSDEVCAMHGLPHGSAPTLTQMLGLYAAECRDSLRREIDNCVRVGAPFDLEIPIATVPGRQHWVRIIGSAQRDDAGVVYKLHGAVQDIDDRRKLQEQLRQAQKMQAVGQLAGGVAHDFNNLLSIIIGFTSLALTDASMAAPARRHLEEVFRASERAAELIRQLLAFSHQQMLLPRVIDLGQVVLGMESMLRRLLSADIELSLNALPNTGMVLADPNQIEQVIMNLTVNARDAMPRGGVLSIDMQSVRVFDPARDGVPPGDYVCVRVSDTGVGMDAATRERIFEPFFTTKEQGKGTGLGLATVFGIIKQSEGHVHVESALGQGTTFKLYFPRTDRPLQNAPPPLVAPATLNGTETILLVEDEEQVRHVIRAVLRQHGYAVLTAHNAGDALLICEQHQGAIDLWVCDVNMPRMNGRELAERLRSMRPELRVLYVSGYAQSSVVHHSALDATVSFLQKPFTPAALLTKVRAALGR